jgi:hypothetical protein
MSSTTYYLKRAANPLLQREISMCAHFVGCWGRHLASESLCIMVQIHLEWSRIPDFKVI